MATTTIIPRPSASSPLNSIQGNIAFGDGDPSTPTVINYAFGTQFGGQLGQAWTNEYKNEFRAALAAIEAVANISFVETSVANADLIEVIAPSSFFDDPYTLGYHYAPINTSYTGPFYGAYNTDYWTANSGLNGNGDPGGYFFTTLVHELGHALGLAHPHDTFLGTTVMDGVTSPFNSFGAGDLNQGVYTVMSYNDGWTEQNGLLSSTAIYGGSTGLGALDIAALQAMYGANTTYNTGDTTYILPPSNAPGTGYQAIWDAGGNDTIWNNSGRDAWIDLRPATLDYSETGGGVVSHASSLIKGGFTIAHGVVIENAIGGVFDDVLVGNTAQNVLKGEYGNDRIYSVSDGTNNNTIYGGRGNDTIYLANGSGADQVFGGRGDDWAIVTNNAGSFSGGSGADTVRFVSAISSYLFIKNGTKYEFIDAVSRITFTVEDDVEAIQFLNGSQTYTRSNIEAAMQLSDIETTGTTLKHASQGIYVLDAGSSNVTLVFNGQAVGQNTIAGWQAIQAEASGGGYKVLWKNVDGTYGEWTVNANGQFLSSSSIGNVADVEAFYGVDLNNDGLTGHGTVTVETNGSTTLVSSSLGSYLINGTIELTLNGAKAGPGSFPGWQAIQAEASGGGYRVLWKNTDGTFGEWVTDASGRFVSSSTIDDVRDVEVFYGANLNNDAQIGHITTSIESNGSTALGWSTNGAYVIGGSIDLKLNQVIAGPNSFPGWQAIQAEASGGGYRVLWKNSDGSYGEWTTNAAGEFQSSATIDNVADVEVFYGVDLNNDGLTGHGTINVESNGGTMLGASTRGEYLIDGTTTLTFNNATVGPNSFPGWQAIQAEASGGGYRVLWKNTDGSYGEWVTDSNGVYVGSNTIPDVAAVETFYGFDIDGSGTVGNGLPKLARVATDDQNTPTGAENLGMSDWDETVDYLKFAPDLDGHEDAEDDYTLVSLHQAQDAVLSVSEDPLAALLSGNTDIEGDEQSLTHMPLLDEDSFWI
ncbi:M10 family metallopeptidase C-terminal domain-containing protein [Ruegeria sp. YS9]|uniref:M10 family metallopeptidase C-terminal domain-containing protein n=1 Tax=Ruegeria sp. YS9 TaxID=2966453 RepID=UPI00214BD9CD|nr:M10 family metallopeptidase C-terminal domain-containing protein [Ruegeria sp. YS9]UUV07864.1 M10 family metallopeptidase C-terminal domain-containing protein [Ruegeria sp. YS9]